MLARLGGDEFAVILPRADDRRRVAVAEALLDSASSVDLATTRPRTRA